MTVRGDSYGAELTTSAADVYVVPQNFIADIQSIHVCNKTNSTKTVTVQWYDASTTLTHSILNTTNVDSYGYIQLREPLHLNPGDKIVALASANSAVDISVRVETLYTPIRTT